MTHQTTKILFIDDEAGYMDPFVVEMEVAGMDVTYCRSVSEALERIRETPFEYDCVVLDIMMPDEGLSDADEGMRTGLVLYDRIRAHGGAEVPVVVHSNLETPDIVRRFRNDEPRCSYLAKRSTLPNRLVEEIRILVRQKG